MTWALLPTCGYNKAHSENRTIAKKTSYVK